MTFEPLILTLSEQLKKHQWKLVTAESCTGGGLAFHLTDLAGSSAWFERGFVTYSNQAKEDCLGVLPATLKKWGAVSSETALEMALGALKNSQSEISVAITGIAGPDGGSADKPVGTIWFGLASVLNQSAVSTVRLQGTRAEIRQAAIQIALEKLLDFIAVKK